MKLFIISLAVLGAASIILLVKYELFDDSRTPLWARMLAIIFMFGGYVGVLALIMSLFGIPLS